MEEIVIWIIIIGAILLIVLPFIFSTMLPGGNVIVATFGFWTVAPIYGLREYRRHIFFAPFLLIGIVTLLRLPIQRLRYVRHRRSVPASPR